MRLQAAQADSNEVVEILLDGDAPYHRSASEPEYADPRRISTSPAL